MKHKKQRVEKSKCLPVGQATTMPSLKAHLEVFAKAVAEGYSHVQAAVMCGRARGSASFLYKQPGVQERIAELRTLAKNATEKEVTENAIRVIRKITIDRNDIIMGIVDCITSKTMPAALVSARVKGWLGLADIFMLRAKTLRDLTEFYGWTDDEIDEFTENHTIPERFRRKIRPSAMGVSADEGSLRTEKLARGPGGAEVGGGSKPVPMGDQPTQDQESIMSHDVSQTMPSVAGEIRTRESAGPSSWRSRPNARLTTN